MNFFNCKYSTQTLKPTAHNIYVILMEGTTRDLHPKFVEKELNNKIKIKIKTSHVPKRF